MDKHKERFYPETRFGGFSNTDGTVAFYTRVQALTAPASVVIDFGCGRGQHSEDPVPFRRSLQCLRGKVAKVIGLDVDPEGSSNPTVDEFRPLDPGQKWPVDDCSADLVLSDSVLEHLPEPALLFREAQRVLVPGGYLCVRTTNLLSYVGIAARMVPNRLHATVLNKVQGLREGKDIFPTLYRCNTIGEVRRQMKLHGFEAAVLGHNAEPSYLNFSRVVYALGVLHQKFGPSAFGGTIFAFGRLPG